MLNKKTLDQLTMQRVKGISQRRVTGKSEKNSHAKVRVKITAEYKKNYNRSRSQKLSEMSRYGITERLKNKIKEVTGEDKIRGNDFKETAFI